ncbi:hypothetical protein J2S16_003967 [Cytobacillus kochii]|nr:hypothetical protein [Cytobacillus kochii]
MRAKLEYAQKRKEVRAELRAKPKYAQKRKEV